MTPLLSCRDVGLSFTGVRALDGVSLEVSQGSLVAIIGPNGAGKTSLFNSISGVVQPQSGQVIFDGQDLVGMPSWRIAPMGIARMFQHPTLYPHLTTLENLLIGRHAGFETRWWQDLLWTRQARAEEVRHRAAVEEVIDFLDLEKVRKTPVGILPYGLLKRIELGRALCMQPRLLLLDEPAAGLNQEETEDMARYVLDLKEELGLTAVLIEHDLRFVMDLADRVNVLEFGRRIAEGTPQEVRQDPRVLAAYVGTEA